MDNYWWLQEKMATYNKSHIAAFSSDRHGSNEASNRSGGFSKWKPELLTMRSCETKWYGVGGKSSLKNIRLGLECEHSFCIPIEAKQWANGMQHRKNKSWNNKHLKPLITVPLIVKHLDHIFWFQLLSTRKTEKHVMFFRHGMRYVWGRRKPPA